MHHHVQPPPVSPEPPFLRRTQPPGESRPNWGRKARGCHGAERRPLLQAAPGPTRRGPFSGPGDPSRCPEQPSSAPPGPPDSCLQDLMCSGQDEVSQPQGRSALPPSEARTTATRVHQAEVPSLPSPPFPKTEGGPSDLETKLGGPNRLLSPASQDGPPDSITRSVRTRGGPAAGKACKRGHAARPVLL